MTALFGGKPKPDASMQKAQRRQDAAIMRQTAEAGKEAGARSRLLNAKRNGGSNLYAETGAAGVKTTFG
jgi:hypothetical protein